MSALVTGAGSGIGAAAARRFAAGGEAVACVDLDGDAAAKVAAECGGASYMLDVTDAGATEEVVAAAVVALGPLRAVAACAGIETNHPALEIDPADARRVLDVNTVGTLLTARAAARHMQESGGGRIVLVASIAAYTAYRGAAHYAASKGAVVAMTRALAIEWAPAIAVNAVAPGVTDTPMSAKSLADPAVREKYMARVPLNRPADASEIAEAIWFLASPAASYITGVTLPVDGGWLTQ